MNNDLQAILAVTQAQALVRRIMEDHERALSIDAAMSNRAEWGTIGKGREARLTGISRGFGEDNAFYESSSTCGGKTMIQKISVAVGWALLTSYNTTVNIDGKFAAEFEDPEYIQPHVALGRLGYVVHGMLDFAQEISPE